MLEDIRAKCENGKITVRWRWQGQNVRYVRVHYRKREYACGDGDLFQKTESLRTENEAYGSASRMYAGENGLYCFTFFLYGTGEELLGKEIREDILLGKQQKIVYGLERREDGSVIVFDAVVGEVQSSTLLVNAAGTKFPVMLPIRSGTRLKMDGVPVDGIQITAVQPYDKLYDLRQRK